MDLRDHAKSRHGFSSFEPRQTRGVSKSFRCWVPRREEREKNSFVGLDAIENGAAWDSDEFDRMTTQLGASTFDVDRRFPAPHAYSAVTSVDRRWRRPPC